MTYTFDSTIVSDLHKDARGFRPSVGWMEFWAEQDDAGKQVTWNILMDELQETMDEDRRREEAAIASFRKQVAEMMALGAKDEHQAKKWIIQGLGADEHDLTYGGSWVCYELGLPYAMRQLFEKACREMVQELHNKDN